MTGPDKTGPEALVPDDEEGVRDAILGALAEAAPLEILGNATKRTIGRPVTASRTLSLAGLTGITLYEPEELVLTARAGTALAEIETVLAEKNQCLAFEPPDWRAMLRSLRPTWRDRAGSGPAPRAIIFWGRVWSPAGERS